MTDRSRLLEARREATVALLAAEAWQPSYRAHSKTFKALLRHDAELEEAVAEYLFSLSERVETYVDWSKLPAPVAAAASPVLRDGDPAWQIEAKLLTEAVQDAIVLLVATGGEAGELAYGIDLGLSPLHEVVLKSARERTATLVSQVSDTTKRLIRESVQQSIDRGEDIDAAVERLKGIVNDPKRAELIARTESVNAYQDGLAAYAEATGAKTKTWESLAGACQICAPLDGKTIPIADYFKLPNGYEVLRPTGHPRCRCGAIYNY